MFDIRIREAVVDRSGKGLQLLFRKVQRGDDFLIDHVVHKGAHSVVFHKIPHDVKSGQVRGEDRGCMGAV